MLNNMTWHEVMLFYFRISLNIMVYFFFINDFFLVFINAYDNRLILLNTRV